MKNQKNRLSLNRLQLNFYADIPAQSQRLLAHRARGPGMGNKKISEGSQRLGGGENWTRVWVKVSEVTEPGPGF